MIERPDPEQIGKINRLTTLLAVAQNSPSLREHILGSEKETVLREIELWYGLSEIDIKESIGWLRKEEMPEGYWFWW